MLNSLRHPDVALLRSRLKPIARDGIAHALSLVGATRPRRFARGALTVVTFHRVLPADRLRLYPLPQLAVTPEQLEAILSHLAAHFSCTSLIDAFERWQSGQAEERPLLAITFDDGSLDNYEHARPVLGRLALKASFYIPVGLIDERIGPWHDRLGFALLRSVAVLRKHRDTNFDELLAPFGCGSADLGALLPEDAVRLAGRSVTHAKQLSPALRAHAVAALEAALDGDPVPDWAGLMSWEQIRELAGEGHEIGSHSLTHPLLPDLDDSALREEVVTSRERLAKAIGSEVRSFCYPNGSYDARSLAAVRDAGYRCAVTTTWGLNQPSASPYELARCDMDYARLEDRSGAFSEERLWLRLSGLQPGLALRAR
jgi:peptidoglycan/xylan/chitin deacetylase (PgdA/CDA1 family)